MIWERRGMVGFPAAYIDWADNSLLQPTPYLLNDEIVRVFCGMRDKTGRSRIGFVDINPDNPNTIMGYSSNPSLDLGGPGLFDESGVVPCALRYEHGSLYMYYAGYELSTTVRFKAYSGLAVSHDEGISFERKKKVPVLDRSDEEPLFRAIHSILKADSGWDIWYGAGERFVPGENKSLPVYNIRYMHSEDGVKFPEVGSVAIDICEDQHRVGRPCVLKTAYGYTMLYGYGSEKRPYTLALALSRDGKVWNKVPGEMSIIGLRDDLDDQMAAYPSVVRTKKGTYLFYNGNEYGKYGFICCKLLADKNSYLSF